jgi:hypothetical protein
MPYVTGPEKTQVAHPSRRTCGWLRRNWRPSPGCLTDTRRCQPAAGPLVAACSWPELVRRGQPAGQIPAKWPDRPRPDIRLNSYVNSS